MRGKTVEDRQLLELLDPVAEAAGYAIVRLRLMGGSKTGRTLQIMGERATGTPEAPAPGDGDMDIDDCGRLSRAVSAVLDAADPIAGEYRLEVSSPGVDRPLTRLQDFVTFDGFEAKLELDRLAEGRKRFRGLLAGVEGDAVGVDLEGEAETAMIPFAWIVEAKLVLTDALLKRGAELRAARLEAEGLEADAEDDSPPPFTGEVARSDGGGSDAELRGDEPPSPASPVLPPLRRGRGHTQEEDA